MANKNYDPGAWREQIEQLDGSADDWPKYDPVQGTGTNDVDLPLSSRLSSAPKRIELGQLAEQEAENAQMPFKSPKPNSRLPKKERQAILKAYYEYYQEKWDEDPPALNRKLSGDAVQKLRELLDSIGCMIVFKADELANQPRPIRQFLDDNPLPEQLSKHLSDNFRVFCLALNALKVWVSAEQPKTDRYLLGKEFKAECREAMTT